jgi:AraC-like DNA-binding protein
MDRHDVSDTVTAEHVAQLHQEDLKVEHKFNCRGLTYWFDDHRKMAFCLIEAPDEEAIHKMHNEAHGELPHSIIEVDDKVVASFLGRIEDPQKSEDTEHDFINDPAFRIIMVTAIESVSLSGTDAEHKARPWVNFNETILHVVQQLGGSIVRQRADCFLISFVSVTKAVLCALELNTKFRELNGRGNLKIGLNAGLPVAEDDELFGATVRLAERMCEVITGPITVSSEVKDLYESENLNSLVDQQYINIVNPSEQKFLNLLMNYTEKTWQDSEFKVEGFSKYLGVSKSQLYRNMISLTGKSPNSFIKEYRLNKALELLEEQVSNISQIAFATGFNSPSYFTKCFLEKYDILPSAYSK